MTSNETPALMALASASARRETEALLRLTARVNDALQIEDIYEPALDAVLELLQVERASILLFDDDGVMRFKAWRGLSEDYRGAVEGHSPWQRGATGVRAFCTPDVDLDAELAPYGELFRRERIRSLAFVPLVCRGELLGKFMAYAESARTFSEHELSLAQAVGAQVAQACARSRLIEAERSARALAERSSDRTRRLLRVTAQLSHALNAEEIAAHVIDEGTLAIGASSGGVWRLEGDTLKLLRQRGYAPGALERVSAIALDEPAPVARCARDAGAIWLESNSAYRAAFPEYSAWSISHRTDSSEVAIAALPLISQGRVIGALAVAFTGVHVFDEPERAFVTMLAQHCAEALERARLYRESLAAERRARFLAQVSARRASSLDAQTTLQNVTELIVPDMADWCAVEVVEADGRVAQLAVKHVDATKSSLVGEIRAKYPPDPNRGAGVLQVIRSSTPELYEIVPEELLVATAVNEEHLSKARALGLRSAIIVPMRAHGHTFGAITFVCGESGRQFSKADLAVAVQVGERAGVALHNAGVYEQAINAVKTRDEFLSVAGHELRTPLTALLLQAQSLLRTADEAPDRERARQRAERLTRNATRLSKLVDELLDVTRISSGRLQLNVERIDLREVVQEVVQAASEQIERQRAVVQVHPSESAVGMWDRHRLEQVIINLLSNALKYSAEQPIEITLAKVDGHAALHVRDHGMGISEEDQQRIFGRFERAVSSRNFGGLGLGLWISRQIVEAHGGTITVRSEQAKGAEFIVRLPLEEET